MPLPRAYAFALAIACGGLFVFWTSRPQGSIDDLFEDVAWTEDVYTIGENVANLELAPRHIYDLRTEQPIVDYERTCFNLAMLRLPRGASWDFLGVTRGPHLRHNTLKILDREVKEQTIVAFGLNLTDAGLFIVSRAELLDLSSPPVYWGSGTKAIEHEYYGAEDPKLFWTDAGTPAMIFPRQSNYGKIFRTMAMVVDVRDVYAPLYDALRGVRCIPPYGSVTHPGRAIDVELVVEEIINGVEKNWAAFYPGVSTSALFPHIHYAIEPSRALLPSVLGARRVRYAGIHSDAPRTSKHCFSIHHPFSTEYKHFHQGTPMYRLTLCPRGCRPTLRNTALFAINQFEDRPRYAKFISVFSVDSPHDAIGVGPVFQFSGTDDEKYITYVMSVAPVQTSGAPPSHFFIDDTAIIGMGRNDTAMSWTTVPMRELLRGVQRC